MRQVSEDGPAAATLTNDMKKEIDMHKLAAVLALLTLGVLTGCNTIQGAGKDIERGGEKIQDGAKNVQQKM